MLASKTNKGKQMNEKQRQEMVSVHDDQAKERGLFPQEGQWVTIVTAAPIYHGLLMAITPTDYLLSEASWVVETGRLSEYVKAPSKTAQEAEFVGEISIPRGAVMGVYKVAAGKIETL